MYTHLLLEQLGHCMGLSMVEQMRWAREKEPRIIFRNIVQRPCHKITDNTTVTNPLLTQSTSETNLTNLNDGEDISEVAVLLAVGEGSVKFKKKRKPRRGEDFTFREAIVKAGFWLLWLVNFL